jgi:3-methyladenine DNA glycosylase AlkD
MHMPTSDADDLLASLRAAAVPGRAEGEKAYLKSQRVHLGTSMPAIRKVAVAFRKAHPALSHADLLALCEDLWARGIHECCALVVELLDLHQPLLEARDLAVLERWLREAHTWALSDGLSASVVGPLVERFPGLQRTLDRWAKDPDFWIRRASLLGLLLALRAGRGDLALFGKRADPMLGETEFFIRKVIGWVLRDTSRRRPAEVAGWLLPRAARASGLTVREATRHLPARDRAKILSAHEAGRAGRAATARAAKAAKGPKAEERAAPRSSRAEGAGRERRPRAPRAGRAPRARRR